MKKPRCVYIVVMVYFCWEILHSSGYSSCTLDTGSFRCSKQHLDSRAVHPIQIHLVNHRVFCIFRAILSKCKHCILECMSIL